MKIKVVTQLLLKDLTQGLKEYGFEYIKSDKTFRRNILGFIQIFDLIFSKKNNNIFVEPTIRLKSLEIEKVYHNISRKESKYFDGTKTLGNNLFKIEEYFDKGLEIDLDDIKSYIVEEEADISILTKVISEKFKLYGLRYFDENSEIARIDFLLNKHPREISIHNWLYPLRACLALIAAKLNKNEKFEELLQIYKEEMLNAAEPYNSEFKDLIVKILSD